ncbi:MAG: C10 family peptidase [Muribaculaceae bacterium]
MKRLTSVLFILLALVASARQVSRQEAAQIASQFLNCTQSSPKRLASVNGKMDESAPQTYYVFNAENNQGFVIVSGDTRAKKILGYSDSGSFDMSNLPPQLSAMLDRLAEQLQGVSEDAVDASWNAPTTYSTEGGVCLPTATWGQGYPYNMYAPKVDGVKCPAGCVATAMAIVMKYNKWPETGRGKHSWYSNGTLMNFDFDNATFDYSLLPDEYTEGNYTEAQAAEVGKLMQAAAASVNMTYAIDGSGAKPCIIGHYMHEYFRYSPKSQYISARNFTENEWISILENEINSNHPVIMSGFSEEAGGHAFVCDGYNAEHFLHINWGWDGASNGYFEPFLLGGFNNDIGMNINLYNDGNTKEYARCWNDYGYLWVTAGTQVGINLTVNDVQQNVPFSAVVGHITFPNDFDGNVCFALVDENENIVEVYEGASLISEPNHDLDHIGYTWVGHGAFKANNVVFATEIKPTMRLQAVAREKDGDWKLVLGTIEAPSSTSVMGNTPNISQIEWHINDPYNLVNVEYQNNNQEHVLFGDNSPFIAHTRGGVSYALIDGIFRTNGSDFSTCGMNFVTQKEKHVIDIYANRYEDLIDKTVELTAPGTLALAIDENERHLIHRLKIIGPTNYEDYRFIVSKLYSLQHLDVSETTIAESEFNRENFFPERAGESYIEEDVLIGGTVWGLETIKLPACLKGFEFRSMPYRSIEALEISAGVETYEGLSLIGYAGMKLEYLKVNNPVPAEIPDKDWSINQRNDIVLMVPRGSKAAYEASPSWSGFKEIRESDTPIVNDFVTVDNVRYLILDDFAVASATHEDAFSIPESVEYNGKQYPVTTHCIGLPHGALHLNRSNIFEIRHLFDHVFTSSPRPNFTGEKCNITWIPGACSEFYDSENTNIQEMWKYAINRSQNAVKVSPNPIYILADAEIKIEKVTINGVEVSRSEGDIYYYTDSEAGLTVQVDFTTPYGVKMTTIYDAEFNEAISDSSVSDILTDAMVLPDIYNLQGILIKRNATIGDINSLAPGLYIIGGRKVFIGRK